jgi:hypothetical protein
VPSEYPLQHWQDASGTPKPNSAPIPRQKRYNVDVGSA